MPAIPQSPPYGIAPTGHRLHTNLRLGGVHLQIRDLAQSLPWYETALGLRTSRRDGPRAELAALGSSEPLVTLHERKDTTPVVPRGRLGLFHVALLLPTRAALGQFVVHLANTGERAGASDHLVSEALYLTDPDGLGIEVYADRPRDAWRHADRQLEMATAPLDVRDLARAGGDRTWCGMPSGTVIGHLHLHVGDLARAEAFYHEALGFDKIVWTYPGALFLSAGGYHHHLGLNTWAAGAPPAGARDARLVAWEIVLPRGADVEAALASVEASGGTVSRTPIPLVRDPWGTTLHLRVAG